MANIDGGALSFKSVMENDQMNSAIEETLRRVQGLSDATVAGGKDMDKAFSQTADGIRQALGKIGEACEIHETELVKLEAQYDQLGKEASAAFRTGRSEEARAIENTQASIQGEITVRKQALEEARALSNVLEQEAQKRENLTKAVEHNAQAHQSLRGRIRQLKEEMALLIDQGIDEQSESYKALVNELGRLQDIQGDIAQQGRILANDEAQFQGVIQGLSGLAGGFSVATGAISLFAGENENLQKIMTKVQSVMAIATGMQSVAQTLNKDSAFQLVTLNGLKEWWASAVAKATIAETAEAGATRLNTAAKEQNAVVTGQVVTAEGIDTAAKGANATAATAGTVANLTLAGAFRAVGLAIKSIPVFGWIVAGISALVAAVGYFSSRASEAKEAQEKLVEQHYKSIGAISELSEKWQALGKDIKEQEQFIRDGQERFKELGIVINDAKDAEDALIANKDRFIQAQVAKAQALAILESEQYKEALKKNLNARIDLKRQSKDFEAYSGEKASTMQDFRVFTDKNGREGYKAPNASADMLRSMKAIHDSNKEISDLYNEHEQLLSEHNQTMTEINRKALEKNKGTVAGKKALLEEEIKDLQEHRGKLKATDTKALGDIDKKIRARRAEIERIEGGSHKTAKDPFVEMLEKRKAEYERLRKWQNSTNEQVQKGAKAEFAELIKGGKSYEEYLKSLHARIEALPQNSRTALQLRAIRNELSELGKTQMDEFKTSLETALTGTESVLKRLDIIAKRRADLKGDDSPLGKEKAQVLDDAEAKAIQEQKAQTEKLLVDYASYLDRKIELDRRYSDELALLERARAAATTDAERERIDRSIAQRKSKHEEDSKKTGDAEYDNMVQTYRTFEEKRSAIAEEYAQKRAKAHEHGNTALLSELEKAEGEALSKLALEEMKKTPDWSKLFGNLDEVGTKELERLLEMIEGKTAVLGIELSPEDFKVVQDKVEQLKDAIRERNPFKALSQGFKDFKNATTKEGKQNALAGMLGSAAKAAQQLGGVLGDVASTLEAVGVEGTEEIGAAINALGGLASGAEAAIKGAMSGNPVQVVGGAIKAIGSVVNYFAGAHDRRAERSIKRHQANVDRLTSAYKQLEWQTQKALGGDIYKHQQASIDNMKQQQRELDEMIRAESSKKKTDDGKIREWRERQKELDRAIADTMESITKDILQTDAKTAASQLGDALVEAFSKGEGAAKSFENVVNSVLRNAVLGQLKKNFLEKQMDSALRGLEKSMGYWITKNGNKEFVFDGLTKDEIDRFKSQASRATQGFKEAFSAYEELFRDTLQEANDTSLTGAVKGVTEETASIVAGQLNAMRINQGEANNMLRQQLSTLTQIAHNTAYNSYLPEIHSTLKGLSGPRGGDPLRAQGLSSV